MKIFGQVLVGIGAFVLLMGAVAFGMTLFFTSQAETVAGTVVNLSTNVDPDYNSELYCPVVKYTTKAGQQLSFNSDICSSPANYKVGDQVQVYYNPKEPTSAQIKDYWSQNLEAVTMAGMSVPFFALGGIVWLGALRRKKPAANGKPA